VHSLAGQEGLGDRVMAVRCSIAALLALSTVRLSQTLDQEAWAGAAAPAAPALISLTIPAEQTGAQGGREVRASVEFVLGAGRLRPQTVPSPTIWERLDREELAAKVVQAIIIQELQVCLAPTAWRREVLGL
jgi:hypothetical protein